MTVIWIAQPEAPDQGDAGASMPKNFKRLWGRLAFPLVMGVLVCLAGCSPKPQVDSRQQTGAGQKTTGDLSDIELGSAKGSSFTLDPDPSLMGEEDGEFWVVAYNVENLFDADGIALFDDYKPEVYQPEMLLEKIRNITRTLSKFQNGRGPEIVLFQEFEADQTPTDSGPDYQRILENYAGTSVDAMLTAELDDQIRDLPAEVFLLKALHDAGMGPYQVAVAEYREDPLGRTVAHVNVTFSRYPIVEARTHHSPGARGTLEVVHQIGKYWLHTFNSHWKSGASNPETELIRLGNAEVLRQRVDEILASDPHADLVLGGDFNSYYNQSQLFSQMPKTAVNHVLGSQGNEASIRDPEGPLLYNLWYELPPQERKSDAYRGKWGTLMQMMITRGLHDYQGVQYVDNSFRVAVFEDFNAQPGSQAPLAWRKVPGEGGGVSDHFPIAARFRIVQDDDPNSYFQLEFPGFEQPEKDIVPLLVDYSGLPKESLQSTADLGSDREIQQAARMGKVLRVKGTVSGEKPFVIRVFDDDYKVWAFDRQFRMEVYERFPLGSAIEFYGELDFHEGMWQFVIRDPAWLDVN